MKLTVDVTIGPAELAARFCELNDEDQAQFFIECAKQMATWPAYNRMGQLSSIGRHLVTCKCSNEDARDVVTQIAESIAYEQRKGCAA